MNVLKPAWISHDENTSVFSVDIHPMGGRFATGGKGGQGGRIAIWNVAPVLSKSDESDPQVPKLLCQMDDHLACVNVVRWSGRKGHLLASGSVDKLVMIWNLAEEVYADKHKKKLKSETWKCIHILKSHDGDVLDLAWDPQKGRLASASADSTVIIWNQKFPEIDAKLEGHNSMVKGVAWDPLSKYIATQSDDQSLLVWRTADWKIEKVIKEAFTKSSETTHVLRLSWSPDGRYLILTNAINEGGPTAKVIERDGWKQNIDFVGHQKAVTCVKFNPNIFKRNNPDSSSEPMHDFCCAIGSKDSSLSVWLTSLIQPLVIINNLFESCVLDISWSKDGLYLLACSCDGDVACLIFNSEKFGTPLTAYERFFYLYVKGKPKNRINNNLMDTQIIKSPELFAENKSESPPIQPKSPIRPTKRKRLRSVNRQTKTRLPCYKKKITPKLLKFVTSTPTKLQPIEVPSVQTSFSSSSSSLETTINVIKEQDQQINENQTIKSPELFAELDKINRTPPKNKSESPPIQPKSPIWPPKRKGLRSDNRQTKTGLPCEKKNNTPMLLKVVPTTPTKLPPVEVPSVQTSFPSSSSSLETTINVIKEQDQQINEKQIIKSPELCAELDKINRTPSKNKSESPPIQPKSPIWPPKRKRLRSVNRQTKTGLPCDEKNITPKLLKVVPTTPTKLPPVEVPSVQTAFPSSSSSQETIENFTKEQDQLIIENQIIQSPEMFAELDKINRTPSKNKSESPPIQPKSLIWPPKRKRLRSVNRQTKTGLPCDKKNITPKLLKVVPTTPTKLPPVEVPSVQTSFPSSSSSLETTINVITEQDQQINEKQIIKSPELCAELDKINRTPLKNKSESPPIQPKSPRSQDKLINEKQIPEVSRIPQQETKGQTSLPPGVAIDKLYDTVEPGDDQTVPFGNVVPLKISPEQVITKKFSSVIVQVTNGIPPRIEIFKATEEKLPVWDTYLGSNISYIEANKKVIVTYCEDLTINVFCQFSGKRLFPPIFIEDELSVLFLAENNNLLVLTKTDLLAMWNLTLRKSILVNVSVKCLLTNQATVSKCSLTESNLPLIELNDGRAYSYCVDLQTWIQLSNPQDYLSGCTNSFPRTTNENLPLASLQKKVSVESSNDKLPPSVKLSFLENQIMASSFLESKEEFKYWILIAINHLLDNGPECRLRSILDELIEPMRVSTKKPIIDNIMGINKKELLREILDIIKTKSPWQRLFREYYDQLMLPDQFKC